LVVAVDVVVVIDAALTPVIPGGAAPPEES
jgi:hypothetical protein